MRHGVMPWSPVVKRLALIFLTAAMAVVVMAGVLQMQSRTPQASAAQIAVLSDALASTSNAAVTSCSWYLGRACRAGGGGGGGGISGLACGAGFAGAGFAGAGFTTCGAGGGGGGGGGCC